MEPELIFGGTFDPVHVGHLIVARAVAESQGYGRVVLMPSATPPHKDGPDATAGQRLEMLRLATEGDKLFHVSDLELNMEGKSYTVRTLEELREHRPGTRPCLLIGMDMLEDLPNWYEAQQVVNMTDFAIAARAPWQGRLEQILPTLRNAFGTEKGNELAESIIETPIIEISSTDIRRRLAEGKTVRYLVPDAVEKYIRDQRLYRKEAR
ncbi:MAG: nicotinate (nicotinamide) nucleotide adenylyltransferase [Phycisphaerae bacterium]